MSGHENRPRAKRQGTVLVSPWPRGSPDGRLFGVLCRPLGPMSLGVPLCSSSVLTCPVPDFLTLSAKKGMDKRKRTNTDSNQTVLMRDVEAGKLTNRPNGELDQQTLGSCATTFDENGAFR